jgi:hypothetical protein
VNAADPRPSLRAYVRAKHEVAALLRDAREFVKVAAPCAEGGVDDLVIRLGQSCFRLVVLGQFKRGKSSLMNAIIGQRLLPPGVLPVTSVITPLTHGSRAHVVPRRANRALTEEVPPAIAELLAGPEHVAAATLAVEASGRSDAARDRCW